MGFPISPLIANLLMEEFEVKAICSTPTLPTGSSLWKTPLSSNRQNTVISSSITSTPKTPISSSPLRTPRKMVPYPLWTLVSWGPNNTLTTNLLQTFPHRPIPTMGQQPLPCSKIQHVEHLNTQGWGSVHKTTFFSTGGTTHQTGTTKMQFSPMGPKQL